MNETRVGPRPVVFCVDDDQDLLDWMSLMLADQGWEVRTEADPAKAQIGRAHV